MFLIEIRLSFLLGTPKIRTRSFFSPNRRGQFSAKKGLKYNQRDKKSLSVSLKLVN